MKIVNFLAFLSYIVEANRRMSGRFKTSLQLQLSGKHFHTHHGHGIK